MKDKVVVYWSDQTPQNIMGELSHFPFGEKALKYTNLGDTQIERCPSFKAVCENTYVVRSPKDFEVTFTDDRKGITWNFPFLYDYLINVKDCFYWRDDYSFSFFFSQMLLWCEEPLVVEQRHPLLCDGDLAHKTHLYGGEFDISKWFRPIENAFRVTNNEEKLTVNRGDVCYFLKFKTDKEIVFKQFKHTPELERLMLECLKTRNVSKSFHSSIANYYNLFASRNMNKRISKAVKEALL